MRATVIRFVLLLLLSAASACQFPRELSEEYQQRRDAQEDINLLAVHCEAWAGTDPLSVKGIVEIMDFGATTSNRMDLVVDFGDGQSDREARSRTRITSGRPAPYRQGGDLSHTYKEPGEYTIAATVHNGRRTADCRMSVAVVMPDEHRPHPQG